MARDVKFIISGNVDKANEALTSMEKTGKNVASVLQREFDMLGVRSTVAVENQRKAYVAAYDKIKASGIATTQELAQAKAGLNAKMLELERGSAGLEGKTLSLGQGFKLLSGYVAAVGLKAFLSEVVQARLEMDRMENTLRAVTGSQRAAAGEMSYLRAEADLLGLSIQDIGSSYGKFAASAKGTAMEGEGVRKVFSSISGAAAVLGLSVEDTNGILLAMGQMLSKGKVQSEELRGQLGERLPGAFEMAAAAMGVTTAQLDKMLESGQIVASDLLPKLAAEIDKRYGKEIPNAVRSTQAELNRLKNAWFDLKVEFGRGSEGGLIRFLTGVVQFSRDILVMMSQLKVAFINSFVDPVTAAVHFLSNAPRMGIRQAAAEFRAELQAMDELAAVSLKKLDERMNKSEAAGVDEAMKKAAAVAAAKEAADKKAADAEKAFLDNLKNSLGAVKEYASGLKDLGKERLKYADEKYLDALKREVALYQQGGRAVEEMLKPVRRYATEVMDIYNQRLQVERDALQKVAALYEEYGKKIRMSQATKDVKQDGVEILKAYRETAEKIIGVEQSRYQTLLEGERKYAAEVLGLIQKKKDEAKELQTYFDDLDRKRRDRKDAELIDQGGDAYDKYFRTLQQLQKEEARAWEMTDSGRRTAALKKIIEQYDAMQEAIEVGSDVIITKQSVIQRAEEEITRIRERMTDKVKAEQSSLEALYQQSIGYAEMYRLKLVELDDLLTKLNRTVRIDLQVNGLDAMRTLAGMAYGASTAPWQTPGWNLPPVEGSYASGTQYVPRTGVYQLHQGERVLNRREASGGGLIIQGGINISLPNVREPEKVDARTLARELYPELQRLQKRAAA